MLYSNARRISLDDSTRATTTQNKNSQVHSNSLFKIQCTRNDDIDAKVVSLMATSHHPRNPLVIIIHLTLLVLVPRRALHFRRVPTTTSQTRFETRRSRPFDYVQCV